jgi:hypothetical protein
MVMSPWRQTAAVLLALGMMIFPLGCTLFQPQLKPEIGPTGSGEEAKSNPPFFQQFDQPPAKLYDLETLSGTLFESLRNKNWEQAANQLQSLRQTWEESKLQVGDKKGLKEANEAIQKLADAVEKQKLPGAYEALNQFLVGVSDIAKSYKLSPLTDILLVGNAARNVSYYVHDKDWSKAAAKVKELEGTWEQAKPSMEQIGILSEITKAHGTIKSLRDAVTSENQGASEGQLKILNESLGAIREFYKNKQQ